MTYWGMKLFFSFCHINPHVLVTYLMCSVGKNFFLPLKHLFYKRLYNYCCSETSTGPWHRCQQWWEQRYVVRCSLMTDSSLHWCIQWDPATIEMTTPLKMCGSVCVRVFVTHLPGEEELWSVVIFRFSSLNICAFHGILQHCPSALSLIATQNYKLN